jgi:hypothetical protein
MRKAVITVMGVVLAGAALLLSWSAGFNAGQDDIRQRIASAFDRPAADDENEIPATIDEQQPNGTGVDDGLEVTWEDWSDRQTGTTRLIKWSFSFVNSGDEPIDLLCVPSSFRLIDDENRVFEPLDRSMELRENEAACGDGVGPGLEGRGALLFQIPIDANLSALEVWDPRAEGANDPDRTAIRFDVSEPLG